MQNDCVGPAEELISTWARYRDPAFSIQHLNIALLPVESPILLLRGMISAVFSGNRRDKINKIMYDI